MLNLCFSSDIWLNMKFLESRKVLLTHLSISLLRTLVVLTLQDTILFKNRILRVNKYFRCVNSSHFAEKKAFLQGGGVIKIFIVRKNARDYMLFLSHLTGRCLGVYCLRIQKKSVYFLYVKIMLFSKMWAEKEFS